MKKILLSLVLVAQLLLSGIQISAETPRTICPDVDDNGSCNSADLTLLRKQLLRVSEGESDVNGDGESNIKDLVCLKKVLTGAYGGDNFISNSTWSN